MFFGGNIHSQNNTVVDSFKNELSLHLERDTTRVNLLYQVAFLSFQRDLDTTKLYLKKTEDLSNDLNDIKGKGKVLYLKGILESRKSNYSESLILFKRSLKYFESIQNLGGISEIYNAFGKTHFIQSEYDKALENFKKASDIFEELGSEKELINNLIAVANVYSETGRYMEAILNYKEALKEYELANDEEGISLVNTNLGVLYKSQGNYPLAIDYYNKGLDYNKKTGDTLAMAMSLNNLGDAYNCIGKYNKALDYNQQALNLSIQKGNKSLIAINNSNIGNAYKRKKEYLKALKHHRISLEISQEINNVSSVSICFYNIGEINLLLNKPLLARENFIKAKDISQKINYQYVLSASYLGIAKTYVEEKKYYESLPFAVKGNDIAIELELLSHQKEASELLSTIYSKTGNYKKAFESHQQYKLLNDSLFNKENIEKIAQVEYEYKYKQELESAEFRELALSQKVEIASNDLEKSQQNLLLGVLVFVLILLILGVIIFFLKLRNIKSETKNIAIEQKLLRSQMTPHFIFNSLSVLQGMILNKEEKKAVSYLSKFSKLLRIILENSRGKTVSLNEELTAVENYLTLQNVEETQAFKYTVVVDNGIDKSQFKIPPMLIQPFIENAIEHAFGDQKENKKIDIHLSYIDKELICTINDNGIGINAQKVNQNKGKKSLATTITSERLEILSKDFNMKGSVCVEDNRVRNEEGTLVTLIIPYKILAA